MKNMKMLTALLKDHAELNEEHEDVKREETDDESENRYNEEDIV